MSPVAERYGAPILEGVTPKGGSLIPILLRLEGGTADPTLQLEQYRIFGWKHPRRRDRCKECSWKG